MYPNSEMEDVASTLMRRCINVICQLRIMRICPNNQNKNYSRTSMASLGPWKCVQDMGGSSHCGLIIALGQEANGHKLGMSFDLL